MNIDKSLAGWVVALIAIMAGFALGVYWLTPEAGRPDLLGRVAPAVGSLFTIIIAAITVKLQHQTKAETVSQNTTLDKIKTQTNGELTQRVKDAVSAALDERTAGETYTPEHAADVAPVAPVAPVVGG